MFLKLRTIVLSLPRPFKRFTVFGVDSVFAVFSVWIAYYLRVGEFLPIFERQDEHYLPHAWILAVTISPIIFRYFGLYHIIFRYAGGTALLSICKAILVYSCVYATLITFIGVDGVPRTVGFIQPLVFFSLVCSSRMLARFWLGEIYQRELEKNNLPQALIYGAGSRGRELATTLSYSQHLRISGFIDDDKQLQGSFINGHKVYAPEDLNDVIRTKNISQVLLALPPSDITRRRKIIYSLPGLGVAVKTLPSTSDISQGRVWLEKIRELNIDDILGRDEVEPDPSLMRQDIEGKVVLVTGAGGSIGSELCRQIMEQNPSSLILLDHSEFALYTINQELSQKFKSFQIKPVLGSVTDRNKIKSIFESFKPETVYHAAAYKHLHLVEENPFEGFANNAWGTLILAKQSIHSGVKKFVLISTDKAVRPTSVMGATKRLAEVTLQGLSTIQNNTLFAIVRFGNVLNSSGSVIPIFREQIRLGGPVTVTHKDVTRYFMTIEEAASLVIQAGAMTEFPPKIGNAAPIYLLDMGEPVKIYELAKKMIDLYCVAGTNLRKSINIEITGLKRGEKLHEELLMDGTHHATTHRKIKVATEKFKSWDEVETIFDEYLTQVEDENDVNITSVLKKYELLRPKEEF